MSKFAIERLIEIINLLGVYFNI